MTKNADELRSPRGLHPQLCADCRRDVRPGVGIDEQFMVQNELWALATEARPADFLCVGCIENRIGRRLRRHDFTGAPLNFDIGKSDRLHRRIWGMP